MANCRPGASWTFGGRLPGPHLADPDPERWHVSSNRGPDATSEPVTAGAIPALLQAWNVEPAGWTRWAGPIHERNPGLDAVERAGRAATVWPEA